MVKLESLTQGEKYRIYHLIPSDDNDETTLIVQLERSECDYIYTSSPTYAFDPDGLPYQ